jgi:hypothetical protein
LVFGWNNTRPFTTPTRIWKNYGTFGAIIFNTIKIKLMSENYDDQSGEAVGALIGWSVGITVTIIVLVILCIVIGLYGGIRGKKVGTVCGDKDIKYLGLAAIITTCIPGFQGLGFILGAIAWGMADSLAKTSACSAKLKFRPSIT